MRYLHTMVRVANIDKSLFFYCDLLGLKEIRRVDNDKGKFSLIFLAAPEDADVAIESKSPLLELTYNWPDSSGDEQEYTAGNNFGHLAFEVENIYSFCDRLKSHGVVINRPPRDGYMAFVKSPDGISIELLQKGHKLEKQEPWSSMENIGSW